MDMTYVKLKREPIVMLIRPGSVTGHPYPRHWWSYVVLPQTK